MFDPSLFKSGFTEQGTKIIPTLADDWMISTTSKNNSINIYSLLLGV